MAPEIGRHRCNSRHLRHPRHPRRPNHARVKLLISLSLPTSRGLAPQRAVPPASGSAEARRLSHLLSSAVPLVLVLVLVVPPPLTTVVPLVLPSLSVPLLPLVVLMAVPRLLRPPICAQCLSAACCYVPCGMLLAIKALISAALVSHITCISRSYA